MIKAFKHCSSEVAFCCICLANTWMCLHRKEILKCSLIKDSSWVLNVRCLFIASA